MYSGELPVHDHVRAGPPYLDGCYVWVYPEGGIDHRRSASFRRSLGLTVKERAEMARFLGNYDGSLPSQGLRGERNRYLYCQLACLYSRWL